MDKKNKEKGRIIYSRSSWVALVSLLLWVCLLFPGCGGPPPGQDGEGRDHAGPPGAITEGGEEQGDRVPPEGEETSFKLQRGDILPGFVLPDLEGREHRLEDYYGQHLMLFFWHSHCFQCQKALPLFEEMISSQAEGESLKVLGINVWEGINQVEEYLQEKNITFPILLDSQGEVLEAYGIKGLPATIGVDNRGEIRVLHEGALCEDAILRMQRAVKGEFEHYPIIL